MKKVLFAIAIASLSLVQVNAQQTDKAAPATKKTTSEKQATPAKATPAKDKATATPAKDKATAAPTKDKATATPAANSGDVKLKKDGTPDKRFKENKHLKKDGTPDKRYKGVKKSDKPASK